MKDWKFTTLFASSFIITIVVTFIVHLIFGLADFTQVLLFNEFFAFVVCAGARMSFLSSFEPSLVEDQYPLNAVGIAFKSSGLGIYAVTSAFAVLVLLAPVLPELGFSDLSFLEAVRVPVAISFALSVLFSSALCLIFGWTREDFQKARSRKREAATNGS